MLVHAKFAFVGSAVLAAASIVAPNVGAQNVWVVADVPGPGVNFVSIQAAVDAAANGDVVLVRGGVYASFTILGKALIVEGAAGEPVIFPESLGPFPSGATVSGTSPSQPVVLRGLGEPSGSQFAVTVKDCSGPVWIEDCHVKGLSGSFGPSAGIAIVNSTSVAILRSAARGGDSPDFSIFATAGAPGLSSANSHVDIYDSTFFGGNGGSASYAAHPGGNGATVNGGSFFAARCAFQGGPGGFGFSIDTSPSFGGAGGAGLAGSGLATTLNVNSAGGLGGGGTIPGALGPPLALTGPHLSLTGPSFTYAVDSPVKEQQSIVLRFHLDVPAQVVLFVAPDPVPPLFFSGVTGPLLLDPAALGYADLGPFPAGLTTLSIPIGNLPPTLAASALSTQSVFLDPSLTFVEIGPPSHILVLDSVY